jgi:methionine-rich copper-binding protein CopC
VDPGANLAGTVSLSATAGTTATKVVFERRPVGGSTWTAFDTDTSAPWTGTMSTTALADGRYDLRAVASDAVNNQGFSATSTVRVDNTLPTGSLSSPAANAQLGTASTTLTASASDGGSGVASVTFQYRVAGAGLYTDVGSDTTSPFETAWTPPLTGSFELRLKVTDNAGNVLTGTAVAVTVAGGTATLTLADPGSTVSGTQSLTTSTGTLITKVAFQASPAGQNQWTTFATVTSSPFTGTWSTTALADGLYDLQAVGYDQSGSAVATSRRDGIRTDNTRPRITSSTPADGSTVSSGNSIALTASESIASLSAAKLDGQTVTAAVSGTSITVSTSSFTAGPHALEGVITDQAGKATYFRVSFSVPASSTDVPYIEKNTSADASTTVTAVDGSTTVTVPAGSYTKPAESSQGSDWLVLRVDPQPAPTTLPSGFTGAGTTVEITATWAMANTKQTTFSQPLDVVVATTPAAKTVPGTFENNAWRMLQQTPTAGTLPATWNDGFYVASDGLHILTRHLTQFALFVDSNAPAAPTGFTGTLTAGTLTLSWTPGKDTNGAAVTTIVYVNGVEFGVYDPSVTTAAMGPFDSSDTRTFALAAVDAAGNVSSKTKALVGVPAVYGKSRTEATGLLAARGLTTGTVTTVASNAAKDVVVAPTTTRLVEEGSAIALTVSSGSSSSTGGTPTSTGATPTSTTGGTPKPITNPAQPASARLTFNVVGTRSFSLKNRRFIGARVNISKAAQMTATLINPQGRAVYRWRLRVGAGATIVRLVIPRTVTKAGRYAVVWRATSGGQTARQRILVRINAGATTTTRKPRTTTPVEKPVDVLIAGTSVSVQIARGLPPTTRILRANLSTLFALVASKSRNVQVVVIDVSRYGLRPVSDLRLVFPSIRIVALAADLKTQLKAQQAGATVAMPRSTSLASLRATIDGLAHPFAKRPLTRTNR